MNTFKGEETTHEYHHVGNNKYRVPSQVPWTDHDLMNYYESNGTPNQVPQENKGDFKILKKANEKARVCNI